jgi:hypothetical protein
VTYRQLKHGTVRLNDRVMLEYVPWPKPKGRHVLAWYQPELCRGRLLVGEYKTWQVNEYIRQPPGNYGKGGGRNRTVMHRESWVRANGEKVATDIFTFKEWKAEILDREISARVVA